MIEQQIDRITMLRDMAHRSLMESYDVGAPRDEIRDLSLAELWFIRRYYTLWHRRKRMETIVVYTVKRYSKWAWNVPTGQVKGDDIYKAVGAPHWGSMALIQGDENMPIERDHVYLVPEEIPADAEFRVSW